ncbi:hypothetical protein CHELA1G11_12734 [Hyphomicrobiales bacterium]|nr:hypothetical protein CHELA1G2_11573 [Hyphomicrobiales bacterium]CAH1666751.1 hypothetical protein CHELA1G11_12734 [Hyphomicrobiales bacterium]
MPTETLALIEVSAVVGDFQIGAGQFPPINPLTIKGSSGDNDIRLRSEADMVIITQGGQDVIRSCAGANMITPGGGADTLYLEYGHTTLRYESFADSTLSTTYGISFFTHGRDKIDLTGLGLSLAPQDVLEAAQAAVTAQTSLSAALNVFAQLTARHGAGHFPYGAYIYAFGNNGAAAFRSTEDLVIRLGWNAGLTGDDFVF